jgi:hypothetical protein
MAGIIGIAIIIVPSVPCKRTQKKSLLALRGSVLAGWFLQIEHELYE